MMSLETLSTTLHQLMHAYKAQLLVGIKQQNISLPITHIRVLKGVGRIPQCTALAITHRMKRDKAQITRALKQLLESGFIDKAQNPNDKRSHILIPTAKGQEMLSKIDLIEQQAASHMTRDLQIEDLNNFMQIATTMINNSDESKAPDQGAQ